jgi:hypothetical protein
MTSVHRRVQTALCLAAMFIAVTARADVLAVNFVNSDLSGAPGDVLTFSGTIENTGSDPLYINGIGVTGLGGIPPDNIDYTDFIVEGPIDSIDGGGSFGPFDFFTVTIPNPFSAGDLDGTVNFEGGSTTDDQELLGSADFGVQVTEGSPATVPEPASIWLLVTAAAAAMGVRRRVRR